MRSRRPHGAISEGWIRPFEPASSGHSIATWRIPSVVMSSSSPEPGISVYGWAIGASASPGTTKRRRSSYCECFHAVARTIAEPAACSSAAAAASLSRARRRSDSTRVIARREHRESVLQRAAAALSTNEWAGLDSNQRPTDYEWAGKWLGSARLALVRDGWSSGRGLDLPSWGQISGQVGPPDMRRVTSERNRAP